MKYDCVIIGAGTSGLMLAASKKINRGIIVEGTDKVGTKLLMSGGGHCNITHGGSIKEFVNCYGEAGSAVRKLLYRHNNQELIGWLESNGIATTELDGRVFPADMNAHSILNMLIKLAKENGWEFKLNSPVRDIKRYGNDWLVNEILTERAVIASGGITYPMTGSDGSVFGIAEALSIEVTELSSALAPIYVRDYPYSELSGISVSDVTVTVFNSEVSGTCQGKAARLSGDILFTHSGFSGPVILNISRYAKPGEAIRINYNKDISELPKRFRNVLQDRARGESGDIKTSKLASLLECDTFTIKSVDDNGMVTRGGIALSEIDTGTMAIKKCPGLFAIGEALDADGYTGGYNLQMCYSTARAAADSI